MFCRKSPRFGPHDTADPVERVMNERTHKVKRWKCVKTIFQKVTPKTMMTATETITMPTTMMKPKPKTTKVPSVSKRFALNVFEWYTDWSRPIDQRSHCGNSTRWESNLKIVESVGVRPGSFVVTGSMGNCTVCNYSCGFVTLFGYIVV